MKKEFKDTKLGIFLTQKAPDLLETVANLLPENGGLGLVKNIITETIGDNKEDLEEMNLALENLHLEYEKLAVQDRNSARDMNVKVNESVHSSWLAKNIAPLIAIFWSFVGGVILILDVFYPIDPNTITATVGIVMVVASFYFGSSEIKLKR